jgi:transcriptional regulator with XRE-family HTH domain
MLCCMSSRDKLLRAFGETLRGFRQDAGLSQEELAHRAGLDRTYVGSVERGERNIAILNVVKLANALGVSPASLLRDLG